MSLSDAAAVISMIAIVMLGIAGLLKIVIVIVQKRNQSPFTEQLRRLINFFLISALVIWLLAGILAFSMASQSNH